MPPRMKPPKPAREPEKPPKRARELTPRPVGRARKVNKTKHKIK